MNIFGNNEYAAMCNVHQFEAAEIIVVAKVNPRQGERALGSYLIGDKYRRQEEKDFHNLLTAGIAKILRQQLKCDRDTIRQAMGLS